MYPWCRRNTLCNSLTQLFLPITVTRTKVSGSNKSNVFTRIPQSAYSPILLQSYHSIRMRFCRNSANGMHVASLQQGRMKSCNTPTAKALHSLESSVSPQHSTAWYGIEVRLVLYSHCSRSFPGAMKDALRHRKSLPEEEACRLLPSSMRVHRSLALRGDWSGW